MQIALGLLASLLIGLSDFLGARSAGRTTPLQTTTAAFLGGACVASLYSPLTGDPNVHDLGYGALSGLAVFVALTLLWRAYSLSSVGVAAPVSAVVSTVLPVLYKAVGGEVPGVLGWLGVTVGVAALVLTSWAPRSESGDSRVGVILGAAAGVAFSAMYLLAVNTSESAGTWPVVSQRATAFVAAVVLGIASGRRPFADTASVRWSLLAGALGASGVAAVVYGGQRGPVAPVVVAGSMYPAVVIGLTWVFLRERLTPRQIVGLLAALIGVALIALD